MDYHEDQSKEDAKLTSSGFSFTRLSHLVRFTALQITVLYKSALNGSGWIYILSHFENAFLLVY